MLKLLVGFVLASIIQTCVGSCSGLNHCNGHGICGINSKCECFEGWGAKSDITEYRSPDCSARVCPSGIAWADIPLRDGSTHNPAECSNKGICNRQNGKCKCFAGYEGSSCQRLKCPNNCSGHGTCVTMERLATKSTGFPLSDFATTYQSSNGSAAWDSLKIVACLCESSWPVGLFANQTQEAEWFGPDCSLRHCPSADNPRTIANETDCSNPNNTAVPGETGNFCQVDCANQGICDYNSGTCRCFDGQYGTDCSLQMEIPVKYYYSSDGIYGAPESATESSSGGSDSGFEFDKEWVESF
mmetsp:Transcript_19470/g.39258  ORF Transcript_19470/g.39258 Transcript_19470/m.39258 type:complete len:300 (+) Transcript_19470:80-979(+)